MIRREKVSDAEAIQVHREKQVENSNNGDAGALCEQVCEDTQAVMVAMGFGCGGKTLMEYGESGEQPGMAMAIHRISGAVRHVHKLNMH